MAHTKLAPPGSVSVVARHSAALSWHGMAQRLGASGCAFNFTRDRPLHRVHAQGAGLGDVFCSGSKQGLGVGANSFSLGVFPPSG